MTDRQLLLHAFIVLSDGLGAWKWENRDCYPLVQLWEQIAIQLNYPINDLVDWIYEHRGHNPQPVVEKWVNENCSHTE